MAAMDTVEHTLFVCREVRIFKIPPRPAAGGHKSGDWKVADNIFTGRMRVVATGEACELRLEDTSSGELFGVCPVPQGQRAVAVEPVSDSSRYFVVRLLDKGSGRHAFVGLGFTDRGEAFDFNVALSDHEKQAHRSSQAETSTTGAAGPSWASKEIASLDTGKDFSLKQGETIRVNMKKAQPSGTGFLSQLGPGGSSSSTRPSPQGAIPAPPGSTGGTARISPRGALQPPPTQQPQQHYQAPQHHQQQPQQAQQPSQQAQAHQAAQDPFMTDLLGLNTAPSQPSKQPTPPVQAHTAPDSWAAF